MAEAEPMRDTRPVLDSEASTLPTMNDVPISIDAATPETVETDEQLMMAFVRGHADAFTALFLRYKQPLFGFFRRRVDDGPLAEELTQETFLAVLQIGRASCREG